MTNFDLSTYIRWLKPGTNNLASAQESNLGTNLPTAPSTDVSSAENAHLLFYKTKSLWEANTNSEEVHERKLPFVSCNKSSSPTALSLLLRSSIFRELVEKNSNISEEENDSESGKDPAVVDNTEGIAGLFDDGSEDIPFALTSDGCGIELHDQFRFNYDCLENQLETTL